MLGGLPIALLDPQRHQTDDRGGASREFGAIGRHHDFGQRRGDSRCRNNAAIAGLFAEAGSHQR